jgi:triosephosphate isomerase
MRSKIVVANFKMNLNHLEMTHYVQKLSWLLDDASHDYAKVEVLLLPSFTNLRSVQLLIQSDKLQLEYGAQDVSSHRTGAHTGEVCAKQLATLGCKYVLTGHTERRKHHGEDDELMMLKATRALEENIKPILCIGELDEEPRETPDFDWLFTQLTPIIQRINKIGKADVIPFLERVVIAYEPRWAVSNGHTCSPEFLQQAMSGLRQKIIAEIGEEAAYGLRLVYGGSVTVNTVGPIVSQNEVDGVLIGKAALEPETFSKIVRVVAKIV